MAKRLKKNKKVSNNKNTKEIDYLKKLVWYSLNACDNRSIELDELFVQQANKLVDQIKKLEKVQ